MCVLRYVFMCNGVLRCVCVEVCVNVFIYVCVCVCVPLCVYVPRAQVVLVGTGGGERRPTD